VAPVEVKTKKGVEVMTTDEHPRPNVDPAKMAKLSPVFKKEG
jgi:acetyl-CoA acetyltransferase